MTTIAEYKVEANAFYGDFVKSSSMTPSQAINELSQNIRKPSKKECLNLDIIFLEKDNNECMLCSSTTGKTKLIKNCKTLVLDDDAEINMTLKDALNSMTALKQTNKDGNPGCFNFGEILSMTALLQKESGRVIYYNKSSKEKWVLKILKKDCPELCNLSTSDETFLKLVTDFLEDTDFKEGDKLEGTLKIIINDYPQDYHIEGQTNFSESCEYINISLISKDRKNKTEIIKYNKYIRPTSIEEIENIPNYSYKLNKQYGICVDNISSKKIKVDVIDILDKKQYNNLSTLVRNPKVSKSPLRRTNKNKNRSQLFINITTFIYPTDYYSEDCSFPKHHRIGLIYNVLGFIFEAKKPENVLKTLYPNFGGNISLQKSLTEIVISLPNKNDSEKVTWIKKNILNFYPDKTKTGDPIISFRYIKNIILADFKKFQDDIDHDYHFQVRDKLVPDINNDLYELNRKQFIKKKEDIETDSEIDSDTDLSSDSESENDDVGDGDKKLLVNTLVGNDNLDIENGEKDDEVDDTENDDKDIVGGDKDNVVIVDEFITTNIDKFKNIPLEILIKLNDSEKKLIVKIIKECKD